MPNAHATTIGADISEQEARSNITPVISVLMVITLWFAAALIATLRCAFAPPPGRLARDPSFAQTRAYRLFHYVGLADFILAFTPGAPATTYAQDTNSIRLLGSAPLALIPGFLVPIFAFGRLSALPQGRTP